MEEILHQLKGSLSHHLHGFYIPGGAGFLPSTVCWFQGGLIIKDFDHCPKSDPISVAPELESAVLRWQSEKCCAPARLVSI